MFKRILPLIAVFLFCSHDMFLKSDPYFFEPNTKVVLQLFNGTYEKSENSIDRSRMLDVSLLGNGQRIAVDSSQWRDIDNAAVLDITTGEAGTWVAGVSTASRVIELSAEDFNSYLEHDGVLDMLEWRRENGALQDDASERYSKHVKTIFQVGDVLSGDWKKPLGYPIEFIPEENPYELHPGHKLPVQLQFKGKPLANQLVLIGLDPANAEAGGDAHSHGPEGDHEHTDGEDTGHTHEGIRSLRTDAEGRLEIDLTESGVWYLRTIHMVASEEPGRTHESNWATLTFAIGKGHTHDATGESHTHDGEADHSHDGEAPHSHDGEADHTHDGGDADHTHDEGLPSYVFWIGSFLILVVLFLWFNRKK